MTQSCSRQAFSAVANIQKVLRGSLLSFRDQHYIPLALFLRGPDHKYECKSNGRPWPLQETGQLAAVAAGKATPGVADPVSRAFWCALGNLYAAARTEAMRLGHAAALRPDASESPMLQNVSAPQDDTALVRKHAPAVDFQDAPPSQHLYWHMESRNFAFAPHHCVFKGLL